MPRAPRDKIPPVPVTPKGWSVTTGGHFLGYVSSEACPTAAEAEARIRHTILRLKPGARLQVRPVYP